MSPSSSSHSTDSEVAVPRRFVEDENARPTFNHSTNGDFVVGIEDAPVVLSYDAQFPTTKCLDKPGLNRRRIVSDDEDLEVQGTAPNVNKSREDEKKLEIKIELPPVVTLQSSSDMEQETIRYFVLSIT